MSNINNQPYADSDMESLSSEADCLGKYLYDSKPAPTKLIPHPIAYNPPSPNQIGQFLQSARKYVSVSACVGGSVVLMEMAGKSQNYLYRPSYFLNGSADFMVSKFWSVGSYVAHLCSYLKWLDFGVLNDLFNPLVRMFTSPYHFFKGYFETAIEYMGDSWKIYVGTFLALIVLIKAYRYIRKRYFN